MNIVIRKFEDKDINSMISIWNEVVKSGKAFPQDELLTKNDALDFFKKQSYCAVASNENNELLGLYILHPNNIGRCGHICNASFAVKSETRGQGIGKLLVTDCLKLAKQLGFKVLQFNAVVASNLVAHHLYNQLGFVKIGEVPGGFLNSNNEYEDIYLYYHTL